MPKKPVTTGIRDKVAITLSMLCVLQCLFLPFVVTLLPLLDIWWLQDHFLHPFLLLIVIPLTIFTLFPGFRQHKNLQPVLFATPALLLLIIGAFMPESVTEKMLTVMGATLLAIAHIRNYLLIRKSCRIN